jgi:hypothetical protein
MTFFIFTYFSFVNFKQYFVRSIWFLNKLVSWRLSKIFFSWGNFFIVVADQGLLELLGPQGLNKFFLGFGSFFSRSFTFYYFLLFFLLFIFFIV